LPAGTLYYGASTPKDNLAPFETDLGTTLACYRSFFSADDAGALVERARTDLETGRVPLPSIKPPGPWAEAARDTGWLDSIVGPLADLDGPVFLIVHHEPENDAAHFGTPSDYVALQEAAIDRAALAGGNIAVVPVLGTWSFHENADRDPREWNVHAASVYGLDLYNPWAEHNGTDWVSFADKFELAQREVDGRPVLIGEYGCRTDPERPGRAAQWLRDAFEVALGGNVVAMSYFNSAVNSPDGSWELDAERLPVFNELLRSPQVARV